MTFLFPHFSFSEKFKRNGLFILVKSLGTLSYPHIGMDLALPSPPLVPELRVQARQAKLG